MAIGNAGTLNGIPKAQRPSDYVLPTVVPVASPHYDRTVVLSVLKATVENADPKVTMLNIINDATIGITKQITDIVTAQFIGTESVSVHAEWISVKTNISTNAPTGDYLKNVAPSYICTVIYYVKST